MNVVNNFEIILILFFLSKAVATETTLMML